MKVRAKEAADQAWVEEVLARYWGGGRIVVHGRTFDARHLPALIAGDREGLATFQTETDRSRAELVTLNAFTPGRGIGTALIETLVSSLCADGIALLRLTTTNDNLRALRLYQRRGFRFVAVRPGAVDETRKTKPTIPLTGEDGIPIHDELELVLAIKPKDDR
jgi:GNAT superfamily N-acetyltransferase